MSLLELKGVETFYGASQALFGVVLDVREGEVVALMGRNGMGKTTTISSILGLVRPRSGSISFAGRQIAGQRPHRIARLGLGLVPEGRRCFPNLTVLENLLAAARGSEWTLRQGRRAVSRGSASGATSMPTRFRAANSRCWRSAAR